MPEEDALPLCDDGGVPDRRKSAGPGEWASVQLLRPPGTVDALDPASLAHDVLSDVPPPYPWEERDPHAEDPREEGITTFRLVPTQRVGRISQPATFDSRERDIGF